MAFARWVTEVCRLSSTASLTSSDKNLEHSDQNVSNLVLRSSLVTSARLVSVCGSSVSVDLQVPFLTFALPFYQLLPP